MKVVLLAGGFGSRISEHTEEKPKPMIEIGQHPILRPASVVSSSTGWRSWINGGFFVFERAVIDYMRDDATVLERDPLERLAADGQLMAFQHEGFWQPMDTLREKNMLESLWESGQAPWKTWT